MTENADDAAVAAMSTPAPVERLWQSVSQRSMANMAPEQLHMARHLFFTGAISILRLLDTLAELTEEEALEQLDKIRKEMELYKTMTNAEVREKKAKAG